MSHLADRLEAARLESASAEAAALDELERKLKWIKPAGISARDLWVRLGSQGDVASLVRRLEALREDGGRAVLVGELWYHGSVTLPHIRLPVAAPEGGNVATPPPPPSSAKLQAATAAERREQILAVLASHDGIRCSDVARAIDANVSTIHNDLMRMQVQGQARKDHNGMWRLAPPPTEPPATPAETSSQIDPPAPRTSEPPPPPADPPASTVEIVAEGEVVATVDPEPQVSEPELEPLEPLTLEEMRESIASARRLLQFVERDFDGALGVSLSRIGELERELARVRGEARRAREDCAALREELERIRGVLRAALGEGT